MTHCAECGMPIENPGEYHPYAACLMYRGCNDSKTVRDNLRAVCNDAYEWGSVLGGHAAFKSTSKGEQT